MKSSNYYKRALSVLLLALLLGVPVLGLCSCVSNSIVIGGDPSQTPAGSVGGDPADSTTGDDEGSKDPDGSGDSATTGDGSDVTTGGDVEKITFTVEVVDGIGFPIKNVVVKLSDGETQGVTNGEGKATIKAPAGTYTFTLEKIGSTAEYVYDTSRCKLDAQNTSVTISLVEKISTDVGNGSEGDSSTNPPAGETISADPDGDGNRSDYYASYVETGSYSVSLQANDMTYLLFVPTVSGQYRISATSSTATVSVGYHGMPHFVQTNNVAEVKGDGYFELNVRPGSITSDGMGTLVAVVGLKTTDGSAADAIVTIERFADYKTDISDIPFEEIQANAQDLKPTPAGNGTLTDVDITDASLTIVKGSDGYYHLGTASGPIVMLRITSASPYIDSFQKMSDSQSLACYEFDPSGALTSKTRWNAVVNSYVECVNEDGVVMLNDQLLEMLQKVGKHMGWWNESHPQYIFSSVNEVTEIAHLFACCYYA